MKTLNDLVKQLNNYKIYGEFYIDQLGDGRYYLFTEYLSSKVISFSKNHPKWIIYPSLGDMNRVVQKDIMDFIYTTDSNHWFDEPEKKYNIVIGKDVGTYGDYVRTAYRKKDKGIEVWDSAKEGNMTSDKYIFTESEIEDLKATLPDNMAKIVELGKVEVKDD